MLALIVTSWPDSEDGYRIAEIDDELAADDETATRAVAEAYLDYAQSLNHDLPDPDVGDIASEIDDETLARHGIRPLDQNFVVVNLDGYTRPLEEWTEATPPSTDNVELDENGLNKKVQFHILPDRDMVEAGFKPPIGKPANWYLCRSVGQDITINVIIPTDGRRGRIDVLDEQFCQPYDYQSILSHNPRHPFASKVRDKVERVMADLDSAGIVTGHRQGEYL